MLSCPEKKEFLPMSNGTFLVPAPINEPIYTYEPGSPERRELKAQLERH